MLPSAATSTASASASAPGVTAAVTRPRQKRTQVVRACDWCRVHRTKCDNSVPCSNCRSRGVQCSNDAVQATSLPHAFREIERLRKKRTSLRQPPSKIGSPPEVSTPGSTLDSGYGDPHKVWGGVHVGTARSPHKTWYGPSSLFYFIGRMAAFLNSGCMQTQPTNPLLDLNPPSLLLDSNRTMDQDESGTRASRSDEYFNGSQRAPSALVDIVLALCVQYGVAKEMPARGKTPGVGDDATVAGNLYYRRCQRLLAFDSEIPTMATVQSHILCCIYLCCGTFQNMADSACGLAVRAAYMVGLHLEPPNTMPLREQEMRKRLWWALFSLDSKIGMKLGRPFLVSPARCSPSLPGDSLEVAAQSGSNFAPLAGNVTWLSFSLHQAKLFEVTRKIHTAFYSSQVYVHDSQTIWDDGDALESHAHFLNSHAAGLEQWRSAVPRALTTKRDAACQSVATDGLTLRIEPYAPLWVQRQRLLLELVYHNLCANLYRPFISFTNTPQSSTAAGEAANKCALHAAELTIITHHVLSSNLNIMSGWNEMFQWQWNAAMILLGFVFAYPHGQSTDRARTAISLAVSVFDLCTKSFAVSASASRIVRELAAKADLVLRDTQSSQSQTMPKRSSLLLTDTHQHDSAFMNNSITGWSMMDESANFGDLLQMACDVEQWIDLGMLWPPNGEVYMEPWLENYGSKASVI
ncbi:hypothetical protein GE09DRAFT_1155909 [Coniochaeta sp. 2T2.1]|nr:hypothetical protein GE09DRAFT_1155909 [Coniochaeta sp. 2T2.1]